MENELIPVEHKGQRILTTKQLAEAYETGEHNINKNFNENKKRFVEGKHFYKLIGKDLKEFKRYITDSDLPININKYSSSLILWTEKGASRMCKILDTDKAWEQFDVLEDTYFRVKENIKLISAQQEIKELKSALYEFKEATKRAEAMYKPSHKMKLNYSRMIRTLTNDDEEYQTVKDWCFGLLQVTKWEDTCIDDAPKIMEIINTVSRLISIKRFEQLRLL